VLFHEIILSSLCAFSWKYILRRCKEDLVVGKVACASLYDFTSALLFYARGQLHPERTPEEAAAEAEAARDDGTDMEVAMKEVRGRCAQAPHASDALAAVLSFPPLLSSPLLATMLFFTFLSLCLLFCCLTF
jgi:hypothetical protein